MGAATQNLRPDPDPTLLTTENLRREIANLKEIVEIRLSASSDARVALHDLILAKLDVLANVTSQQFISINDKFAEKDKAVSVGLSAQKEAAAAQQDSNTSATLKMEDNFTKLLDQGRELLSEVRRNTDVQISDIKSRLDKGQGQGEGKTEGLSMAGAMIIGAAFVMSSIISVVGFAMSLSHVGSH
jgi:hypothetical protein